MRGLWALIAVKVVAGNAGGSRALAKTTAKTSTTTV
jgi:hypothetical protein